MSLHMIRHGLQVALLLLAQHPILREVVEVCLCHILSL